jgi:tetratricopeptide (TPR) repeat protein
MPTKKQEATVAPTDESRAYDAAVKGYAAALALLRKGDLERAKEQLREVQAAAPNEPELRDRAEIYLRICNRKLVKDPDPPSGDERYRQAVFLSNSGKSDAAIELLDRTLAEHPNSVESLYVRACAWALKGGAEEAVKDLRQAISLDPKVRFQAVNDPDFEKIREEPAFIDIIEPTPTGS